MDEFSDFMTDTVTIEPLLAKDAYGAPSFNAPVSYVCRVDGQTNQRVSINGEDRTVKAMIFIQGTPSIGPFDRLTMPAGFLPQQPPILVVNLYTDESGAHHTEIAV